MRGPGGAFALVAVELLSGTFLALLAAIVLWPVISRGHWRATTWMLFPLSAAVAMVFPPHIRILLLVHALAMALFLAAVYTQRPVLEWATGMIGFGTGLYALMRAGAEVCSTACLLGGAHALAGAAFLGTLTHTMALGHWYLNQPRLPLKPLKSSVVLMFASMVLPLALGVLGKRSLIQGAVPASVLAISPSSYWLAWLLMLGGTGALGYMIRETVKTRSTQSATGLLYVAMVPGICAQFVLTMLLAT